jgi:hypothetical protein
LVEKQGAKSLVMSKTLKTLGSLLLLLTSILVMAAIYWQRSQNFDFSQIMPKQLMHCDQLITVNDPSYISLYNWFENNSVGWHSTLVSYVPRHTFSNKHFHVNVMESRVVVNYSDGKSWSVTKTYSTKEIISLCK